MTKTVANSISSKNVVSGKKQVNKKWTEKRKIQSIFLVDGSTHATTCEQCKMSYFKFIDKDLQMHKQYHEKYTSGVKWPPSFKAKTVYCSSIFLNTSGIKKTGNIRKQIEISIIDNRNINQVKKVDEILEIANSELNAPKCNDLWKKAEQNGVGSRAFIATIESHVVGICITESIQDINKQARWLLYETQVVVPSQVNNDLKLGISRIWVAPKWRRLGIAIKLLKCVSENSIYGIRLGKNEIGFSQPSEAGGQLAKRFNSSKHKNGKILIPIYLEL